jgi:RiboL-PSP-HEPN
MMLEQNIRRDIEERQGLMEKVKTLYLRYEFNEKDEQLFLNYSIPAVYAIWEGFVTTTFHTYITELNKLNLTFNLVCEPILIYHFEKSFSQLKEYPKDNVKKIKFFKSLANFYNNSNPTIVLKSVINTESNVTFDVINRILSEFNLSKMQDRAIEYSELEIKTSLSKELERLLDNRNKLAHGQNSVVINRDDLDRAIKLVEMLMDLVLEKIVQGFENQSYLS